VSPRQQAVVFNSASTGLREALRNCVNEAPTCLDEQPEQEAGQIEQLHCVYHHPQFHTVRSFAWPKRRHRGL